VLQRARLEWWLREAGTAPGSEVVRGRCRQSERDRKKAAEGEQGETGATAKHSGIVGFYFPLYLGME
jgi:hypothetical protein